MIGALVRDAAAARLFRVARTAPLCFGGGDARANVAFGRRDHSSWGSSAADRVSRSEMKLLGPNWPWHFRRRYPTRAYR
jgi:hypothetical protein